jgi:ribonuclease E
MSKTHDDGVDPTEGILADLASLRASRDAADAPRDSDPTAQSALDDIAEAAGRLREPRDDAQVREQDSRDEDGSPQPAEDDAPAGYTRARRAQTRTRTPAPAQAPAGGGLFFVADPASQDHSTQDHSAQHQSSQDQSAQDHADSTEPDAATDEDDDAASTPVVDTRNPFSHSTSADPSSYAPIAAPAGGGLLFQPPEAELAEEIDDSWFADDEDDSDDSYDEDGDDSDDDRSDDRGSSRRGDGDDRSRGRRRRGGRGRRSRNRGSGDGADGDDRDDSGRGRGADDRAADDRDSGDRDSDGRDSDDRHSDDRGRDAADGDSAGHGDDDQHDDSGDSGSQGGRRRGGRGRRRRSSGDDGDDSRGENGSQDDAQGRHSGSAQGSGPDQSTGASGADQSDDDSDDDGQGSRRRRRRRGRGARSGGDSGGSGDDQVTSIKGSTRLEAKRQRRREGREAGRRRPLLTEAEFLARRESVTRTMLVREQAGRTQLVVLEDGIAVEHYLSEHKAQASLIGNVYLGRVQNVLPSMEAAFIDIGKGRNAVLYAGEVNWDALGMNGKPHRIEQALSAGDPVLVQVTKDPVGHKGARLTSQISLPGRFLVYIPGNSMTGISRKLPDNERARLKKLLKEILPEKAGVIVRTASEGASDEELGRDVDRLTKRWESIEKKANAPKAQAPRLLYSEPDMIVRIIRDVFNEDFDSLVIDGDGAWDTIHEYVEAVAPDLLERVSRYGAEDTPTAQAAAQGTDMFDHFRVNEQVEKALSRKVNLPSGGSLVIDRTEAMTVVDVNTGKFTGSGGNLEETVTKNNLEAAEEVIRQLRLRDIGGIIVVDFIDMVLESNRDLVTRRLVECLARDRTRHQVAEVTSLGLVQMTRKRIGTGLAESFDAAGEDMSGRGLMLPGTDEKDSGSSNRGRGRRSRGGDQGGRSGDQAASQQDPEAEKKQDQSRSAVAAIAKATLKKSDDEEHADQSPADASAKDQDRAAADVGDAQNGDDRNRDDQSGDAQNGEEKSSGRRSRRRGGRSRGRGSAQRDDGDQQQQDSSSAVTPAADTAAAETVATDAAVDGESKPKADEPTAEVSNAEQSTAQEPAAQEPTAQEPKAEAWRAFVPAQDSGPAPFMIGADSTTTVQTRSEPEPQPAAEPTAPAETTTASATEAESDEDADEGADEASGSQPQKPALPILMLGMED